MEPGLDKLGDYPTKNYPTNIILISDANMIIGGPPTPGASSSITQGCIDKKTTWQYYDLHTVVTILDLERY